MRSTSSLAFALAFALGAAASAQVEVRASLDPPVVPFHKSAILTLVVEAPAGTEVTVPDVRDVLGDLKVKGTPALKREFIGEDRVRTTEQYVLDPIHIRSYFIRPLEVTWAGGSLTVPIPAFRARDLTPEELADAGNFVAELPGGPGVNTGTRRPVWQWIALAAAIIALAVAAYVLLRGKRAALAPEPIKTPWQIAKERLALLDTRQLPQQGKFDAFYVDLSSILRYYIEGRFQLHAPERTTPEFLAETVGKNYFSPDQEVFLSRFLRLCDRVKFARFRPDLEETARSFDEVARFVEDTIPRETPQPEAQEAAAA